MRRAHGERGAAMVELVIILPVLLLIVFGAISAALSYEHKSEIVQAVRDGARYGATLPLGQCDTVANCNNLNWAQLVQYVTAQRSNGTLSTDSTTIQTQICVALVSTTAGTVYSRSPGVYTTGTNSTFPTVGCFSDGTTDSSTRVHVSVVHGGDRINLIFSSLPITVSSSATERYEAS